MKTSSLSIYRDLHALVDIMTNNSFFVLVFTKSCALFIVAYVHCTHIVNIMFITFKTVLALWVCHC